MIVYLDDKNMCHKDYKEGYTEAEHQFFDTIPPLAIECYKFIPERDFIQCVDSKTATAYQMQSNEDDKQLSKVIDEVYNADVEMIGG